MPVPDLVTRFRRDLEALTETPVPRLGVAVSGGPDSLALLLIADAALPNRIEAATVDHGVRPENADDARHVAGICRERGIAHAILAKPENMAFPRSSLQAQARALRYYVLGEWAGREQLPAVATAHHADDQAETVLMRLARGSGLAGLASIRAARPINHFNTEVLLVRPLLGWTRSELRTVVTDAGLRPVDDPSNRSLRHDRTHVRNLLGETRFLRPKRLAASAAHLGESEIALEWSTEAEWNRRVTASDDLETFDIEVAGLPREIKRRLARLAIHWVRLETGHLGEWRSERLGDLVDQLDKGARRTFAQVLCTGGPIWRFEPAPPRTTKS